MTGINEEIKKELLLEMGKELRNSSKVRIRNRCIINGNGRGIVRKYRMSRHELKKWVCLGRLPLKRAS
jgi:ribosomal protein S14